MILANADLVQNADHIQMQNESKHKTYSNEDWVQIFIAPKNGSHPNEDWTQI